MFQALMRPADRQFRRKCQRAAALSFLFFMLCSRVSVRVHNSPAGFVMAGLAGAFFFAQLVTVGLLTLKLRDEFQRVLLTRSFVWATLITMALTTIWGFIELHGHGAVRHLDLVWVPIVLVVVTAGAKVLIFRRYRPEHE